VTRWGEANTATLGWIALPNMFLFQLLLPIVSPPVIDLLFSRLAALVWGFRSFHFTHVPQLWTGADVQRSPRFSLSDSC